MIEPIKLQNIYPVNKPGTAGQIPAVKKDPGFPIVQPAADGDMVQISSDAALKGKLNAFSAALFKEMNSAAGPERIARLREQYAGDACPVSAADIAGAIVARLRAEGFGDE
ncbi:MAG: hypothetical protein FWG28_02740 [Clostridiales bacterium]|nr:hypothetical protein [Clostridiales bacterium]